TFTLATLAWSVVGGADGYAVFLNGSRVASVGASATSYTFTGLRCATGYTLGVETTKSGLTSSLVTRAVTTAGCGPAPVQTPTGLSVPTVTSTSALLAWSPVAADGYVLFLNGS